MSVFCTRFRDKQINNPDLSSESRPASVLFSICLIELDNKLTAPQRWYNGIRKLYTGSFCQFRRTTRTLLLVVSLLLLRDWNSLPLNCRTQWLKCNGMQGNAVPHLQFMPQSVPPPQTVIML